MRTRREDLTAKAIIRNESLRLFAAAGPDAVTVRQVAAAAGVSPALVIRHYGSKDGLREAVDDHVVTVLEAMLSELSSSPPGGPFDPARASGLATALIAHLEPDTPIPAYLGRMLVDGQHGSRLFRRLYAASQQALASVVAVGGVDPGEDPEVRAAFLLANDLAVLILRSHLADVLGVDPLSPAGMARWGAEVLSVYRAGLTPTTGGQGPASAATPTI